MREMAYTFAVIVWSIHCILRVDCFSAKYAKRITRHSLKRNIQYVSYRMRFVQLFVRKWKQLKSQWKNNRFLINSLLCLEFEFYTRYIPFWTVTVWPRSKSRPTLTYRNRSNVSIIFSNSNNTSAHGSIARLIYSIFYRKRRLSKTNAKHYTRGTRAYDLYS
jgi:hypothetical protein